MKASYISAIILCAAALSIGSAFLTSCASAPTGSATLSTTYAQVEPEIEPGAALATTGFLISQGQGQNVGKEASYASAAATILESLTGGSSPASTASLQSALTAVAPADAKYAALVPVIVSIYSGILPKTTSASQLDTVLQDIAAGVSEAAAPYASK